MEFISTELQLEISVNSLCYDDESNSVIVEYKRGKSYSVIDQGYSYLSVMLNNKSDLYLSILRRQEKLKDSADWSQSRIIFISTSFNTYQKNSVNFKDVPFELWEIRKFEEDIISLTQHLASSKESIEKFSGGKTMS